VLGFILGGVIERYLFISIQRYGAGWMLRPMVIVMFLLAALSLLRPFVQDIRSHGGFSGMLADFARPRFTPTALFPLALLGLLALMLQQAVGWDFAARIIPLIVGSLAVLFCVLTLINQVFKRPATPFGLEDQPRAQISKKIHMDIASNVSHLPARTILFRGMIFFAWIVVFLGGMALIGLIPTVPLFIIAFMRIEGHEPWRIVLPTALVMVLFIYGLFDQLLAIQWPGTVLGDLLPALKQIIPSL
jgi:hypothetical protein